MLTQTEEERIRAWDGGPWLSPKGQETGLGVSLTPAAGPAVLPLIEREAPRLSRLVSPPPLGLSPFPHAAVSVGVEAFSRHVFK